MAPIPTGYVLFKFRHRLVGDLEEMICTVGAETTASTAQNRTDSCDYAFDNWRDNVIPNMANTYSIVGVDGVFGSASGDITHTSTAAANNGGSASAPLPQNCAVLVRKNSGVGGRANRGRLYVPGPAEGTISSTGVIDATPLAAWQTAFNNFLLGFPIDPLVGDAVIFHSDVALPPTVITDFRVDSVIATQRRRLRR